MATRRASRYVVVVVGLLAVIGILVAVKASQIGMLIGFGKKMEQAGPPPEAVSSTRADQQSWEATITAVGSVASDKGVAISAEVPGVVTRISFESGAVVKQGQVLVELDTSVERAQLASAIARRTLATSTHGRTRALAEKGAISPAQLESDESQLRTATTDVEAIQAQIAKKTIRAPFAGRLGIRNVNLGQYLNPGAAVTVLETNDAVHVDFALPQQRLAELSVGMPVRVIVDAEAGAPIEGKVAAVDPSIDPTTRTIKLRADLPTDDPRLRAGMFVNVEVLLPQKSAIVVVPQTAVVHAPYGDSVFVVEAKKPDAPGMRTTPDGKTVKVARQQFVRLGPQRGDFVAIVDGVKAGEEVVSAGAFKLRNNAPVVLEDPKLAPTPQISPRPENR